MRLGYKIEGERYLIKLVGKAKRMKKEGVLLDKA